MLNDECIVGAEIYYIGKKYHFNGLAKITKVVYSEDFLSEVEYFYISDSLGYWNSDYAWNFEYLDQFKLSAAKKVDCPCGIHRVDCTYHKI